MPNIPIHNRISTNLGSLLNQTFVSWLDKSMSGVDPGEARVRQSQRCVDYVGIT
jgi:hypothetical protein